MAFMIKEIIDLKGILLLMLLTIPSQATNFDCNGKAFHCVNSTHFMICVDLGRGISTTIDEIIIPCPPPTMCRRTNRYECEFPVHSVLEPEVSTNASALTTDSEATTFVPYITTSIPFQEYFNTLSTTTVSESELQSFTTDSSLGVEPNTVRLDITNVSTPKIVLEENVKSDTRNISLANSVKSNDTNNNKVENNVTLNPNEIPSEFWQPSMDSSITNTTSAINNQAATTENILTSDVQRPTAIETTTDTTNAVPKNTVTTAEVFTIDSQQLSIDATATDITISNQTVTTEKVTTDFRNISENVKATHSTSGVAKHAVNTKKKFTKQFRQPSIDASTTKSTSDFNNLVVTTEHFLTTDARKPSVIEIAIDTTSAVTENSITTEELFTNVLQQPPKNITATDITSNINNQTVTTEKIFTTNVQESTVNIITAEISNNVTERTNTIKVFSKPLVNARATDIASAVTEHLLAVTTEEVITHLQQPSLKGIKTEKTSAINNQTGYIQEDLIKDLKEPAVSRKATDITNAVTEYTLNTQKLFKNLEEPLVNSTLTDIISEQTLTTEGLLSNGRRKPSMNATPDTTSTVLESTVGNEGLTDTTATDSTYINDQTSISEKVFTNNFQQLPTNVTSTIITSNFKEKTVSTKSLTKNIEKPSENATISENSFIAPDTSLTVEHTQDVRDVINSSALLKRIENESVSNANKYLETTNNTMLYVEEQFDTREMKSSILNSDNNNIDNVTSSNNAATETTLTGVQENTFYNQKPPKAPTVYFNYFASKPKSVITAELITEDNNVANTTDLKTEIMVDTKVSLTKVSVNLTVQTNTISNDSISNNENKIINLNKLIISDNAKIATKNESNQESSQSKEQDSFTDSLVSNPGGNKLETEASTDVNTTTMATTTIEIIKTDILWSAKNSTTELPSPTKTTKPTTVPKLGNTILSNQLEIFTNSTVIAITPTSNLTTENFIRNSQNYAENNDLNSLQENTTDILVMNKTILFTDYETAIPSVSSLVKVNEYSKNMSGPYLSEQITTVRIAEHYKKAIKEDENLDSLNKTFSHTENVAQNGTLSTSPHLSNIAKTAADEIGTLTSPIPIVDKDTISSTEYNKLQSQAYTVPMDTSTSSSFSETGKFDVSHILPDYNMLAEKTVKTSTILNPNNKKITQTVFSYQSSPSDTSFTILDFSNILSSEKTENLNDNDRKNLAASFSSRILPERNITQNIISSISFSTASSIEKENAAAERNTLITANTGNTFATDTYIVEPVVLAIQNKSNVKIVENINESSRKSVSKESTTVMPITITDLVETIQKPQSKMQISTTELFDTTITQSSIYTAHSSDNLQDVSTSHPDVYLIASTVVEAKIPVKYHIDPKINANESNTKTSNDPNLDLLSVMSNSNVERSILPTVSVTGNTADIMVAVTTYEKDFIEEPINTTSSISSTTSSIESVKFTMQATTPIIANLSKQNGKSLPISTNFNSVSPLVTKSIVIEIPQMITATQSFKMPQKSQHYTQNKDLPSNTAHVLEDTAVKSQVGIENSFITPIAQQKGSQTTPLPSLRDLRVTTKVITRSDFIIYKSMENEQTHSGIISFLTSPPTHHDTKEEKEKSDKKESEIKERLEYIGENQDTISDKVISTPPKEIFIAIKNNNKEVKNINSTRQEMQMKTKNNNFKSIDTVTIEKPSLTKPYLDKNSDKSMSTVGSENKNKSPTKHELIENSTASTINNHTSNNESKDQNKSLLYAHNMSVISNDQSSKSRYMSNTNTTAAGDTQTAGFSAFESTTTNKFSCAHKKRGRYADELNCRKFYICLGNTHIVEGMCPVNTVFSEIRKQCTKNLSQCIRNNQFRCVAEGHFSDFLNDNVYYICVKKNKTSFIRFKLYCQNGYHLNKTTVRCVLNNESTQSSSNSDQSASLTKTEEKEKPEKKFKVSFSEIRKQCTKNLSQCIRNNQFRCVTEGHFSDFLNDNVYYICVKKNKTSFIRFKLLCQNGYHFNKTTVRCDLNNESKQSSSNSDSSKTNSDQSASLTKTEEKEKPEKKFKCKQEGIFADPSNCKKYFECTKSDKTAYRQKRKKCDSGEIFNRDKKKCVDSDSYEC